MIILRTDTDAQVIKFTPREYIISGKIVLVRKNERDAIIYPAEFSRVGNYMEASASFELTEGSRYSLIVVSSSLEFFNRVSEDTGIAEAVFCTEQEISNAIGEDDVYYRDIVLCTDQSEYDRYNVQKGDYVQANTNDNKYIVRH